MYWPQHPVSARGGSLFAAVHGPQDRGLRATGEVVGDGVGGVAVEGVAGEVLHVAQGDAGVESDRDGAVPQPMGVRCLAMPASRASAATRY